MGAVPVAATLNVAAWPALTVWLVGCVVIAGATADGGGAVVAAFTFKYTGRLITLPVLLATLTVNPVLLSAVVVTGVV
jgi:hypothetical protein